MWYTPEGLSLHLKWIPEGLSPSFKMHPGGTVPPFKMHPRGTVPPFKIHHGGTLSFIIYIFKLDFGLYSKNNQLYERFLAKMWAGSYFSFRDQNRMKQCNSNIKFLTEYENEYICKRKFHRIQISNIFISRRLTEYEYRIYSFLITWPNTNT